MLTALTCRPTRVSIGILVTSEWCWSMASYDTSVPEASALGAAAAVAVSLRGVGRVFAGHDRTVLRDLTLEVAAGEVVALLGASGCGKSTLLRLVSGLDAPTSGEILVDSVAVRGVEPRCAVVFQDPRLLPWRTIARNVAYGLPRGVDRLTARAEVRRWLDVVGLGDFAGHRPRQVSGGMAQRAALARALARRPGVLLLDEPFASLDALTRLRMQDLLGEVQRTEGTTILLVTHDVDEALRLADRVVLLGTDESSGPGAGSTIQAVFDVDTFRAAAIRAELLDRLGVPGHAIDVRKETL
jgi:sulfonate transport system ATP-binding protein